MAFKYGEVSEAPTFCSTGFGKVQRLTLARIMLGSGYSGFVQECV